MKTLLNIIQLHRTADSRELAEVFKFGRSIFHVIPFNELPPQARILRCIGKIGDTSHARFFNGLIATVSENIRFLALSEGNESEVLETIEDILATTGDLAFQLLKNGRFEQHFYKEIVEKYVALQKETGLANINLFPAQEAREEAPVDTDYKELLCMIFSQQMPDPVLT